MHLIQLSAQVNTTEVPSEDYRLPVSNPSAATMSFLTLVLGGDSGVSLKTVQGSIAEKERTLATT